MRHPSIKGQFYNSVVSIRWRSRLWLCVTPWLQHSRLPCPSLSPGICSDLCPLSQRCYLTISSSAPPSSFVFILSLHQGLFQWARGPKYWSFSFSISPSSEYSELISFRTDCFDLFAFQGAFQESSPAPQFECISSSVVSLLYGPILTSIHSFDYTHLCRQAMSLLFNILSRFLIALLLRS